MNGPHPLRRYRHFDKKLLIDFPQHEMRLLDHLLRALRDDLRMQLAASGQEIPDAFQHFDGVLALIHQDGWIGRNAIIGIHGIKPLNLINIRIINQD